MEPNQDYLVQQGIALASMEDRPVDFRVHVHKDGEGIWQLVCMAGRLGGVQVPSSTLVDCANRRRLCWAGCSGTRRRIRKR